MDAAVNGVIATGDQEVKLRDGSTRVNSAAERSLQIRRSQAKDRAALTKQIDEAQSRIVKLQEEKAPIAADLRKVEAEVGPIKYIAALIYGDDPDTNTLERAVRWVIIIIVAVFDPLAVMLLLASQYSFAWFRQQREAEEGIASKELPRQDEPVKTVLTGPGASFPTDMAPRYPDNDNDLEELMDALEAAVRNSEEEENVPINTRADVSSVVEQPDSVVESVGVVTPTVEDKPKRQRRVKAVAPPGTPGEEWALSTEDSTNSEQQEDSNLDKIYKESSEDLAKRIRSRGWFQAKFPTKDN